MEPLKWDEKRIIKQEGNVIDTKITITIEPPAPAESVSKLLTNIKQEEPLEIIDDFNSVIEPPPKKVRVKRIKQTPEQKRIKQLQKRRRYYQRKKLKFAADPEYKARMQQQRRDRRQRQLMRETSTERELRIDRDRERYRQRQQVQRDKIVQLKTDNRNPIRRYSLRTKSQLTENE